MCPSNPKRQITTIARVDTATIARLEVRYWEMRICELVAQQDAIAAYLLDARFKLKRARAKRDDLAKQEERLTA